MRAQLTWHPGLPGCACAGMLARTHENISVERPCALHTEPPSKNLKVSMLPIVLEIIRLGIPRLGTWRKQKQGFYEKVIWPPMALRIGLPGSSALQNDGHIMPVILQCRTPQETNPKGHWGPNCFFIKSLFLLPPCTQSWYTQSYDL